MLRGGSWDDGWNYVRAANRYYSNPYDSRPTTSASGVRFRQESELLVLLGGV